jgi:2-polyprenyl-6-hydroxyphenyl methylase / 3-demethylubiquinone-9 3-methyltransferase
MNQPEPNPRSQSKRSTAERSTGSDSVDREEISRFDRIADDWWNPRGSMRPLHELNPVRLEFIRERATRIFGDGANRAKPLFGLKVLDIGCGGGLLCEPLTRMGATVTGIDPGAQSIAAARRHAERMRLSIDYRASTVEAIAAGAERFDIVVASEVIEHVADTASFVKAAAACLAPGGLFLGSTINRTRRAYAFAILGAEMILRLLPRGTHDWEKFVTPEEFRSLLEGEGLTNAETAGMIFNPLTGRWRLGADTAINYWIAAEKPR